FIFPWENWNHLEKRYIFTVTPIWSLLYKNNGTNELLLEHGRLVTDVRTILYAFAVHASVNAQNIRTHINEKDICVVILMDSS
ncbi:hypothetical protein ACJX0J_038819, partial [Zea mays]